MKNIFKFNIFYILTGLIFLLSTCKKEPLITICENLALKESCQQLDFSECPGMEVYFTKYPYYTSATFNPLNPDEFICYEYTADGVSLIKFNIETEVKQILLQNFPYKFTGRPVWSRTGWIAFSSRNWKIWRLKEDGSDLKQITFQEDDQNPEFNFKGDNIIYSKNMNYTNMQLINDPELNLQRNNTIIDVDGNVLESICQTDPDNFNCKQWTISSWGSTNKILYKIQGNLKTGVAFFDYNTYQRRDIFVEEFKGKNEIIDIQWHPTQTSFYYSTPSAIMQYHIYSGVRTKIRESCSSGTYSNISISPDGSKILSDRNEFELKDKCNAIGERYIVLIQADGCQEERIFIPE